METTTPERTPVGRVIALSAGLALIVGIITLAFAWPSAGMGPNGIPIAVIGPDQAAEQVQDQLDAVEPDGFEVSTAADADGARTLIEEREAYAALQIAPDGVTVYTATAASPTVARLITGMAEQMAAQAGQAAGEPGSVRVAVEDLVPLPADDPNGAGLAAAGLPLAAGGIIMAVLIGSAVRGSGRQIAAAILAPLAIGAGVAAVLLFVLESLDGDYLAISGAIALATAGAGWLILGLRKLLGNPGIAVGAIIVMLVGNPLSGMTGAPELLPAPWGAFGQLLPPGAGATLLRSTAYFEGHGGQAAVWTLAAWAAVGAVLFAVGAIRAKGEGVSAEKSEAVPVPA
ncbi:ABC transporter permease [Glycomyces sp. NRRL B-16210]|uniref:ABC transporter permease n=1 Tax=Glycomyces sp. NRRL B-16210 TaxID=1463821 RepID=UPI0004C2655A|nr:ABC transporter permease [Glycomyces sp. NRRL B-16210]